MNIHKTYLADEEYSDGEASVTLSQTLRIDTELFKDEDNVIEKVIGVRRAALPQNGENWEVLEDDCVVLVLHGIRFTNKERDFLRTIDGILFIMNGWKHGWKAISKYKSAIKGRV